jgi:hypothetical protein
MPSGGDSGDIFVAKLDANGAPLWGKGFTSSAPQGSRGLAIAADANCNAFIAGAFHGNVTFGGNMVSAGANQAGFVARLDGQSGNVAWVKVLSGTGPAEATSIAVKGADTLAVAGKFEKTLQIPTAGAAATLTAADTRDLFAAKFGQDGAYQWAGTFAVNDGEMSSTDGTIGTALDSEGNVLVAGDWTEQIQFNLKEVPAPSGGMIDIFVGKLEP